MMVIHPNCRTGPTPSRSNAKNPRFQGLESDAFFGSLGFLILSPFLTFSLANLATCLLSILVAPAGLRSRILDCFRGWTLPDRQTERMEICQNTN